MIDGPDAGRQPQPLGRVRGNRWIEHHGARNDLRMPEELLDPPTLVGDAGNSAELPGREGGRNGNLADRRGFAWRRPEGVVWPFDRPVIVECLRGADVVRQTELDGFGAVGNGAAAHRCDEVGARLPSCGSGFNDGAAWRVRRHPGEHPGAAVPERRPHVVDLASRAVERAAHHQEDALGSIPPCLLGDRLCGGFAKHHRIHLTKSDPPRSQHCVSLPACWLQRIYRGAAVCVTLR